MRERLHHIPPLNPNHLPAWELHLRDCQEITIVNLEESFKADRPRSLVQMATGSGKTYAAITSIYRLLKHANAKRILFLVDTKNLAEQTEQEMMSYVPIDDNRKAASVLNGELVELIDTKLTAQWRAENHDKPETTVALLKRIQQERMQRYQQQLAEWKNKSRRSGQLVQIMHELLPSHAKVQLVTICHQLKQPRLP